MLGAMLELGDASDELHAAVGREAAELGVDEVLVVGESAAAIADGARDNAREDGPRVRVVPDADSAEAVLVAVQRLYLPADLDPPTGVMRLPVFHDAP